jgi:CelD/BcsL family acetyltransferase involved in cellulose biosynthesis
MTQHLEEVSLSSLVSDQRLIREWRRLASTVPQASYFQTPDWIVSWWETIGKRPAGSAALVWDGDELNGIAALARVREHLTKRVRLRFSVMTNAGTGVGTDHAGWLSMNGAGSLLADWLKSQGGVLLRGVPMDLGQALGGRLIERQVCPRLEIGELDERMSSKLAKNLRHARRRLDDQGVLFKWKAPGEGTQHDLESLYTLHELRRIDAGDKPVFDDPSRRAFHDRLLDLADTTGGTGVIVASQGDRVVGVLYGFVWQKTFAYYQIGWDPSFRSLSLGSVLVLEAIEASAAVGLEVFDFLRGAEDYKYRFGATDVEEGSFAVGGSLGLRLIEAVGNTRQRLRL